MNYQEIYDKCVKWKQTHLLAYYDELDDTAKQALLAQIEETDFSVLNSIGNKETAAHKEKITPLAAMELSEIEECAERFMQIGVDALRQGKVGAVLLAGGMGTRLGSDAPKGVYDIGLTRPVYIFQRLIENLMDVVKLVGTWIPLYVMTSDKNHEATVSFLKEHAYFGYDADSIFFFKQEMAPASDYEGKIFLEKKNKLSTSPNGNGGWFVSLDRAGLLDYIHTHGVAYLNVFAVDNVLQRIADPKFIGAVIEKDVAVGAKVVRKNAPDEKVGVMCLADGKPSIVEYYELTDELMNTKDANGNPAYNFGVILNYLFRVADLERMMSKKLPLHIVEKKIPYIDADGREVRPEQPNGYKYEQLVLDMIHELGTCLPYEVVRSYEFAPIKNATGVDSVESARLLCKQNGIEL